VQAGSQNASNLHVSVVAFRLSRVRDPNRRLVRARFYGRQCRYARLGYASERTHNRRYQAWHFLVAPGFYRLRRIVAAPYFPWKEDQAEIRRLSLELSRTDRVGQDEARKLLVQSKVELAARISQLNLAACLVSPDDVRDGELNVHKSRT